MKQFSEMTAKEKLAALVTAGKELQKVLAPNPPITLKGGQKVVSASVQEAAALLDPSVPEDKLTDGVFALLNELGFLPEKYVEKYTEADDDASDDASDDGDEEKVSKKDKKKKGKKDKKKKGKKEKAEEAAPEKGSVKDKGEKPEASKKAPKGPGIIATIVECVEGASKKKGISKDEILKVLTKRFPEKEPDSMKSTINVQVPNRITRERFKVEKTKDGGYYKGSDEPVAAAPKKDKKIEEVKEDKKDKKKKDKKDKKKGKKKNKK